MPVPRTSGLAHVLRMADEALLAWSPAVPIAVHPSHQILLRIDPGLDPYWKPTDPKVGAQPAAASSPSLRSAARRWPTPVAFRTSIAPFGSSPMAPSPAASVSGVSALGPHSAAAFRGQAVPSRPPGLIELTNGVECRARAQEGNLIPLSVQKPLVRPSARKRLVTCPPCRYREIAGCMSHPSRRREG